MTNLDKEVCTTTPVLLNALIKACKVKYFWVSVFASIACPVFAYKLIEEADFNRRMHLLFGMQVLFIIQFNQHVIIQNRFFGILGAIADIIRQSSHSHHTQSNNSALPDPLPDISYTS